MRAITGICADYCPRCNGVVPDRGVRCTRCGEVIYRD